MLEVYPAILTSNKNELKTMLDKSLGKAQRVQVDIIDGLFADNKTIDPREVADLNPTIPIDFHLMVKEPDFWIGKCRGTSGRIIGQIEMMDEQRDFVERVKKAKFAPGLALDLETPLDTLDDEVLGEVDCILLMAVPAGFGGQEFRPKVLNKIKALDNIRKTKKFTFSIIVDGGVNRENAAMIAEAGADEVSVGKSLFEGNIEDNIHDFQQASMESDILVHHPRSIIKNIAFFGDSHTEEDDPTYIDAYEIAKELAEKGFVIVNGGGPGIMNASTQGARAVGGETISVTFDPKDAPGFEGRYLGNTTDQEIKTTNYIERMFKLMEHADMYIIFKGGSGTISEFGTAWVLAKLYFGHHKPFILYGNYWAEIIDVFRKNMNLDREEMSAFEIVGRKEDIMPAIRRFDKKIAAHDHTKDCKVCLDKAFRI